jgi:KIF-binding protein
MFELGLAYSDILDIKLERLKYEDVQPQALSKINKLCHKAIEKFQEFADSYRDKKSSVIPTNLDVDDYQAIACAYFNLGRLYYKLITPDKKMQLDNTNHSYNNYKIFIEYCETHKEVAERMKGEKSVTQSMIELLPHKMKKLRDEIMQ